MGYKDFKFLARGGNGIVVKAKNKFHDLDVAIKICDASHKEDDRVSEEVEAYSKSALPVQGYSSNLVVLYDMWTQPLDHIKDSDLRDRISAFNQDCTTVRCYSMELCEYNLRNVLSGKDFTFLPDQDNEMYSKISIFNHLVCAVKMLHTQGIIHRDLKPENVLFAKTSATTTTLKIADFESARSIKQMHDSDGSLNFTECTGTKLYCAPEQMTSTDYGDKVDTHALGVILFECLHDMKSRDELERNIFTCRTTGRLPDSLEHEFPVLSELIKAMIDEDPANRPSIHHLHLIFSDLMRQHKEHGMTGIRQWMNDGDSQSEIARSPCCCVIS
jgi:serine/threonine protein kinase